MFKLNLDYIPYYKIKINLNKLDGIDRKVLRVSRFFLAIFQNLSMYYAEILFLKILLYYQVCVNEYCTSLSNFVCLYFLYSSKVMDCSHSFFEKYSFLK